MFLSNFVKRSVVVAVLLPALVFVPVADSLAQSSTPRRSRAIDRSNPEDDRNPVVFERNIKAVADRAISLGSEMGLPPETLEQIANLRQQLDTFGPSEYAAVAEQLGLQIGQANRAMSRIVVVSTTAEAEPEPQPFSGSTWAFDPNNVVIARYPAFDFAADDTASGDGSTNTNTRVCSNHLTIGCAADADCPAGDSCIDRPTNANESHDIQIFSGCAARPTDAGIRDLAIVAVVFEGVQMVADRICGMTFFGFNISLVCIITDLLFLVNRTFLDFEVMCADRWSGAENQSAYDRLGHLHGDVESFESSVDNYFTSTTGPVFLLQQSVNTHFSSMALQLTTFETSVDTKFMTTNTNIDNTRTLTNLNIDNTRTLTNTNIDNTRTAIQTQLTAQGDLFLRAEIERILLHRERLAMYYLPEAQGGKLGLIRQIVQETIDRVEASRETTNNARMWLGYANIDIAAGRFKRAFQYLSAAYFEAIKYVGEQQTF